MWIQLPDTTGIRWRRLLAVAGGVLLLLVAVVSYAAFGNPDPSAEPRTTSAPPSSEPIATQTSPPALDAAEPEPSHDKSRRHCFPGTHGPRALRSR